MQKIGLIGLCTTKKSFVSKIIRFFRRPFIEGDFVPTHAFLILGELNSEPIIGESTDPHMRMYPFSKYAKSVGKRIELWAIENISLEDKMQGATLRMQKTGTTYGYLQTLGYAWMTIGKWFGKDWHNPITIKREEPCADYTWNFLKDIGYDDTNLISMSPNDVAPDTILTSLRNNPNCRLVAFKNYEDFDITWLN